MFRPTDEDFIRKILRFGLAFTRAKSTLQFNASREIRDFQDSGEQDEFYGGSMSLVWNFAARSTIGGSGGIIDRQFSGDEIEDTYWYVGTRITRRFGRYVNGNISYRHIQRDASESDGSSYKENRLIIGIETQF